MGSKEVTCFREMMKPRWESNPHLTLRNGATLILLSYGAAALRGFLRFAGTLSSYIELTTSIVLV